MSKKPALAWLQSKYPEVSVCFDLIDGVRDIRKFGKNNDVDSTSVPETIWVGGGLYPFQAAAYQAEAVSADAADAAAGTGARSIRLLGLAGDDWLSAEEDVIMNGTTAVSTVRTDWRRIDRSFVVSAGTGGVNAGAITVRLQGAGATQAIIEAEFGQTQQAATTVPGNYQGGIISWSTHMLNIANTEMEIGLFTRDNSLSNPAWRIRSHMGLMGNGDTSFQDPFRVPIMVGPKTDIDIRVVASNANNVRVASIFEILQVQMVLL